MTKRSVSLILAAVLLLSLLSGCGKTPDKTTDPTESPYSGEVPNVVNGVYATCENYCFTYYDRHNYRYIGFRLITEKPLPEDAHIVLNDITSDCTVQIRDLTDKEGKNLKADVYWFMKEPDKDWAAHMAELQRLHSEIQRLTLLAYGKEEQDPGDAAIDQNAKAELTKVYNEYYDLRDRPYRDEYLEWKQTSAEPMCYCYSVSITVNRVAQREQLKSMELVAGDMSRTITMANVWLDIFDLKQSAYSWPDVDMQTQWEFPPIDDKFGYNINHYFSADNAVDYPYGTGMSQTSISQFIPKEDMLLKDMYVYGDNSRVKIERVEFVIMNSQNQVVQVNWIPGTEFMLRKGEKVAMRTYYSDTNTQQMNYLIIAMAVLEYECCGEARQWNRRFRASRAVDAPELYLWAFKGLDIESYYVDYYNPDQKMLLND